jgi:hypothetical protein
MHRRAGILLFLTLSFAVSGKCQDHPQHKAHPVGLRPDGGTFVNGVYKNGYFGFSYVLGEGWSLNDDLMQAGRVQALRMPGSFSLLIADRQTGKPRREQMLLSAEDMASFKAPVKLEALVQKMARALVKAKEVELTRDAYAVDYAGESFFRADFKESYSGGALYKAFLANEYEGFLFSWMFVADSEERLNQIVNSLNSLSFTDGHK